MALADLLTAVADLVTDYPIITAVISLGAVFGGLKLFGRAMKSTAR